MVSGQDPRQAHAQQRPCTTSVSVQGKLTTISTLHMEMVVIDALYIIYLIHVLLFCSIVRKRKKHGKQQQTSSTE